MKTTSLLRACGFAFLVLGMNAALLGPSLQTLSKNTGAGLAELGAVFTLLSLGYLLAAPLTALLGPGRERWLLVMPLGLTAAMGAIIAAHGLGVLLVGALALGISQAATQVGFTASLARSLSAEPDMEGRLNRVNASYGLGALLSPALAALSFAWTGEATAAYLACIALWTDLSNAALDRHLALSRQ